MSKFGDKYSVAVFSFAQSLQSIMEDDKFSEAIATKVESNPKMTVEELTKEMAVNLIEGLSEEYEIKK